MICPICNGKGEITCIRPKTLEGKIEMVKRLKKLNLNMRQIAKLMDYKSVRSVQVLLDKK